MTATTSTPTAPLFTGRNVLAVSAIIAAMALIQLAMGRTLICTCGTIKLWHGVVLSSENSQHLTDWYSPSHVLHGLVFYFALRYVLPRSSLAFRLVVATLIEAVWEVVENTDAVIEYYRSETISLDYFGDSVVNSMSDAAMMVLGFVIAARAPAWFSIALFVASELIVGYFIRDGLILNVIMLLYPLDAIRQWQAAAIILLPARTPTRSRPFTMARQLPIAIMVLAASLAASSAARAESGGGVSGDFFSEQYRFEQKDRNAREEGYVLQPLYNKQGKRAGQLSLGGGDDYQPSFEQPVEYNYTPQRFDDHGSGMINLRLKF